MPSLTLTVPLPPPALRSNNRAPWWARVKAKQAYSSLVLTAARDSIGGRWPETLEVAKVTYTWRWCGVEPDRQNLGANLKALTDILCMAPKSTQPNGTTYLGLIEDDKGIEPHYKLKQVAHRAEQGVVIEIEALCDARAIG